MIAIIDQIFGFMSNLFEMITNNWYMSLIIGLFVIGSILSLVLSLFRKRRTR